MLSTALKALVRGRFLTPAGGDRSYALGENGVELHRNWLRVHREHFRLREVTEAEFDPALLLLSGGDRGVCIAKKHRQRERFDDVVYRFEVTDEGKNRIDIDGGGIVETMALLPSNGGGGGTWTFPYHDLLRKRRGWWKHHFFNPGSVHVVESDARTGEAPSARIESLFEGQGFELCGDHVMELESIRMLPDGVVVSTKTSAHGSTIALMLDAVRGRIFAPEGAVYHPRIALHRDLAPFQVAFGVAEGSSLPGSTLSVLTELKEHLAGLLESERVKVWRREDADDRFCNEYEAADAHGIPYLVVVTPQTLEDGIVHVRDRETSWFEQVHASHLARRFVRCFQDRDVSLPPSSEL